MPSYHQMGHDSWNLVSEEALGKFRGLVLSPVNDSPEEVARRLPDLGTRRNHLEIILDPQFYKPKSDRGSLPEWAHVDSDFNTADLGNMTWWAERCRALVEQGERIGVSAIASPAAIPRAFDDAYYGWVVECAETLQTSLEGRTSGSPDYSVSPPARTGEGRNSGEDCLNFDAVVNFEDLSSAPRRCNTQAAKS